MKTLLRMVGLLAVGGATTAWGQVVLNTAAGSYTYSQNFDSINSGFPAGWGGYSGAAASALGTLQTLTTAATSWVDTTGAFKNQAATEAPATSADSSATQGGRSDRMFGVKLTSAFGNTSKIGFVFQFQTTSAIDITALSFKFMTAPVTQNGSRTWQWDYRVGNSGSFTSLTTGAYTDSGNGVWGATNVTFNSADLAALSSVAGTVQLRFWSPTGGITGTQNSYGIDDFSMSYTAIPEPSSFAALAGLGMLGFCALRRRRC